MKRRDFLVIGSGAAGLSAAGCKTMSASGAFDMGGHLAWLDGTLDRISSSRPIGSQIPRGRPITRRQKVWIDDTDQLMRQSFRSLVVTGAYRDMPEAERGHPEVKQRLALVAPDMDASILDTTSRLERMTATELADVQDYLRKHPDTGMRIAESVGASAKQDGVPMARRAHLRGMFTHVSWRLAHQPPGLLVNEYTRKVRKAEARYLEHPELQRRVLTSVLDDGLYQEEVVRRRASWDRVGRTNPFASGPDSLTYEEWQEYEEHEEEREPVRPKHDSEPEKIEKPLPRLDIGFIVSGIGVTLLGLGGGMLGLGSPDVAIAGAFVMTFGGLALLAGIIILIIQGIRRANRS
jgi:hypothetical protein